MTHALRSLPWAGCASLARAGPSLAHPDTDAFVPSAVLQAPRVLDCRLEDETESQCHWITVCYLPDGLKTGPFWPAKMDDAGGIWDWTGENSGLYHIDRDFLRMFEGLGYRVFDDHGTFDAFDRAPERPTVDHACLNVSDDESVEITMLLSVEPVMADMPTQLGSVGTVGVALEGFALDGCRETDGSEPVGLDQRNGHIGEDGIYHCHTSADFPNLPPCLVGVQEQDNFTTAATTGIGAPDRMVVPKHLAMAPTACHRDLRRPQRTWLRAASADGSVWRSGAAT